MTVSPLTGSQPQAPATPLTRRATSEDAPHGRPGRRQAGGAAAAARKDASVALMPVLGKLLRAHQADAGMVRRTWQGRARAGGGGRGRHGVRRERGGDGEAAAVAFAFPLLPAFPLGSGPPLCAQAAPLAALLRLMEPRMWSLKQGDCDFGSLARAVADTFFR